MWRLCHGSRGKIHQAFSLRFHIPQAIKLPPLSPLELRKAWEGLGTRLRLNWAFQKFCCRITTLQTILCELVEDEVKAPSCFINNSANWTIVGLRGCQLWILIWAMNIVSKLIAHLSTALKLLPTSGKSVWLSSVQWNLYNAYTIGAIWSFMSKEVSLLRRLLVYFQYVLVPLSVMKARSKALSCCTMKG